MHYCCLSYSCHAIRLCSDGGFSFGRDSCLSLHGCTCCAFPWQLVLHISMHGVAKWKVLGSKLAQHTPQLLQLFRSILARLGARTWLSPGCSFKRFLPSCFWNMADCVTRASSGKGCLVAVGTRSHTGTVPPALQVIHYKCSCIRRISLRVIVRSCTLCTEGSFLKHS
jgi:hypothetical protein